MTGYLSVWIRGGGMSNEPTAAFVRQLNPRSVLVLNEAKLSAMCAFVPRNIFRAKGSAGILDDDSAYAKHSPTLFAEARHNLAPPGAWIYGDNEPGSDNLYAQNEWNLRFVERCAQLGRKPLIHNQSMQHPLSGRTGWQVLKSSAEAAKQAGGAIGPHIYYYPTIATERQRQPRNSFMVLDEVRDVFGSDMPLVIGEFGYAEGYDPYKGYHGYLPEEDYADEHERLASIAQKYDADFLTYGIFPPGTEWESFNLWLADAWLKPRMVLINQLVEVPTESGDMVYVRKPGVTYALNIRSGPSATAAIIGSVAPTELVILLEANVDQGWVKVRKGATAGFVSLQNWLSFPNQVKVVAA